MTTEKTQNLKQSINSYYEQRSLSDEQLQQLQEKIRLARTMSGATKTADDGNGHSFPPARPLTRDLARFLARSLTKPLTRPLVWAATLSLLVLLFTGLPNLIQTQAPDIINDAYADINKDSDLHNGMQPSMSQWLQENRIFSVPEQYPVEMSKFCHLDQYLTTHLRLAGSEQGHMHLFIHHGDTSFGWNKQSGDMNDMKWQLLKVRDDLSIIVLYSHDMRERSVKNILHGMFPELSA